MIVAVTRPIQGTYGQLQQVTYKARTWTAASTRLPKTATGFRDWVRVLCARLRMPVNRMVCLCAENSVLLRFARLMLIIPSFAYSYIILQLLYLVSLQVLDTSA